MPSERKFNVSLSMKIKGESTSVKTQGVAMGPIKKLTIKFYFS
jgi:hypothetical protein